jgi:hypothetical protein
MSNQITGTVKAITQATQRGNTIVQTVVVEEQTGGQYPEIAVIDFVGKRYEKAKDKLDQLKVGQQVEVGFNYSGREWNGKWFGGLSGWKLFIQGGYAAPQQQAQPAQGQPAPSPQDTEAPALF